MPQWKPENSPVWDLLAKARPRRASGAFVQNVVREARQTDNSVEEGPAWLSWLQTNPGAALAGLAAVLLAMSFAIPHLFPKQAVQTPVAEEKPVESASIPVLEIADAEVDVLAEEYAMMSLVDEIMGVQDPTQLDEDAIAELLF